VGTGSGCIAVACALAFPDAAVTATDISSEALEVARKNVEQHQLAARLRLRQADLLDGVEGTYDIIISNPPYVPESEQTVLPEEYGHEPPLGLFSGSDGLDSARRILQDAPRLLSRNGILVLEVGAQWQALERAFPSVAFTWLEFEQGGEGVALLRAADLP
jgi:ribosomal protein L3 glutamine methyltransferase